MAAFSPPPGYRYPITTWRSAPADASDSSVRARTPGLFSTSARQSVMCFTVTDISDTSFETQSILSRQNPIHALPVVLAEPQQDFYRRRHDAPLHFGKLALRDAQERGKIILSLRSPELSDRLCCEKPESDCGRVRRCPFGPPILSSGGIMKAPSSSSVCVGTCASH